MDVEDARKGTKVLIDNNPYNVEDLEFMKPGKGRAIYRFRFRNLIDGTSMERTLHSGDKLQEANITTREGQFLYRESDHYIFMNTDTFEQYLIDEKQLGKKQYYLKDGMTVTTLFLRDRPLDITLPIFIMGTVMKSDVATRTDTVTAQMKRATLDTGLELDVPVFIKEGDVIKVDTRTGTYVERVTVKK